MKNVLCWHYKSHRDIISHYKRSLHYDIVGYYLYIEASNPRVLGHKSVISKQYSGIGTNGSCLTFWYHLYGSSMGQLNVYLKNKLQDASTSPSWNLIGEQGDRWEMGQVTLTKDRSVVWDLISIFSYLLCINILRYTILEKTHFLM